MELARSWAAGALVIFLGVGAHAASVGGAPSSSVLTPPQGPQGLGSGAAGNAGPVVIGGNVQAKYSSFGRGCAGSAGGEGFVVPRGYDRRFGGTQTRELLSIDGQRVQVLFAPEQVAGTKVFLGLAFRYDELFGNSAGQMRLQLRLGGTSQRPETLGVHRTWGQNFDNGLSGLVFDGTLDLPEKPNHSVDLGNFTPSLRFDRPMPFVHAAGRSLLIELSCLSNSGGNHYIDAVQLGETSRDVATSFGRMSAHYPTEVRRGFAPVLKLLSPTDGVHPPILSTVGRPQLGRSFGVCVHDARKLSAGLLLTGLSNELYGESMLPLDLSSWGHPGCALLCSVDFARPIQTDYNGFASQLVVIPKDPKLIGMRFFQQFWIHDPQAPLGFSLSQGGEAVIGDM